MGDVNFYLKKAEESTGKSLIYLQFKYPPGKRLVFSFGERIDRKDWNEKKQRVKAVKATTEDGKRFINDVLNNLENGLLLAYNTEKKLGVPSVDKLKEYLQEIINPDLKRGPDEPNDFFGLLKEFTENRILSGGKSKKPNTIKKFKTLEKHLREFEKKYKYKVTFESITREFYNRYIQFLRDKNLKDNSIGKDIRLIKTVMNEAVDQDLTNNIDFRKRSFVAPSEETDAVALTEDEILKLYRLDLKANLRLDRVRDLFVFGCYTGLRFSDYSSIKPENIRNIDDDVFIDKRTTKTGERVIIPCNPIILQIFKKYPESPNGLPPAPSNQKMNEYLKELGELAKFTKTGRLSKDPEKKLYECLTTHVARRSFATNLYLDNFPIYDIMKITGHRTEASFRMYIKLDKLNTAQKLKAHNNKKNWSEIMLKAVS